MEKPTVKDLISSIITGLTTGLCVKWILTFLAIESFTEGKPNILYEYREYFIHIIWLVPILWIIGVSLGYFLGRWFSVFNQFGRFAAVGFTNAAVDFTFLNLLISYTDVTSGPLFSLYKAVSFLAAFVHSYFWNKFWVFETRKDHGGVEFGKFFLVTVISIAVNVGATSVVVDGIGPLSGTDDNIWANISAIFGSAVALIFNFLAYRWVVFKK